ncbi:MAG: DNA2/NAM7 family helicase [Chromatiaceae bacterium]|nr:DNA2/NAM7 family helicase [Chromatiaceae bacterium]
MGERAFVKHLESVQGDERDQILFSLGYAPQERTRRDGQIERYVPARFGPLGQKGGESRLNVAVSRAKREILVVSSFDRVLLSVARTASTRDRSPSSSSWSTPITWPKAAATRPSKAPTKMR